MSNIHDGVSCDACNKSNFSGKRYKCLICYDFDLCSNCYDQGAINAQHINTHPMQCILTRSDYELYFGGDNILEPQSFTCPYCGKLGFNEVTLSEHITIEHEDDSYEVVCPICAAIPTGDPNHLTDDLLNHINMEHRQTSREFGGGNNGTGGGGGGGGGGSLNDDNSTRFTRRINTRNLNRGRGIMSSFSNSGSTNNNSSSGRNAFHFGSNSAFSFSSSGGSNSPLISLDCRDPIAELLSQLSGVRRAAQSAQSSTLHLQQLQAQLSREREHLQQLRQQQQQQQQQQQPLVFGFLSSQSNTTNTTTTITSSKQSITNNSQQATQQQTQQNQVINSQILDLPNLFQNSNSSKDTRFLLSKYDNGHEKDKETSQNINKNIINQSIFTFDMILSILMQQIPNDDNYNLTSSSNNNNTNEASSDLES